MTTVTLFIASVASFLVLFLSPATAFAVYLTSLIIYPSFLVVRLGPLDISVGRIVVAILLLRCLCSIDIRKKFVWHRLDSWILFGWILSFTIPMVSSVVPLMQKLEQQSGAMMDTFFAYFVARYCITSRDGMVAVIKWIGIVMVPLACLGIIEATTGWQPFRALVRFCPWAEQIPPADMRHGFYRAVGPLVHPILFGTTFVLFLPMIYYLRNERGKWRPLGFFLSITASIGALTSMAAGPWVMLITTIVCLTLERFKNWTKPLIIFLICSVIGVGIISNRSFYHVIATYTNPLGGSGWHRAKLMDLAIEHFDEWWLAGYGGRPIGWGLSLGMGWTDVTNEYIMFGVKYGMLGVIALVGVLVSSLLKVQRLHNTTDDPKLKSFYWALGSIVVVLMISFNTCAFFGQAFTLFYCILGMIGSAGCMLPGCNKVLRLNS